MYRGIAYSVLFVVAVLLQVLLLDSLFIIPFGVPMLYLSFIILQPFDRNAFAMLGLGLLLGLAMDLLSGMDGLYTISALWLAFVRRGVVILSLGKDALRESFVPSARVLGGGRFWLYTLSALLFHNVVFFLFEALTFDNLHITLSRIVVSTIFSAPFIWAAAKLFPSFNKK